MLILWIPEDDMESLGGTRFCRGPLGSMENEGPAKKHDLIHPFSLWDGVFALFQFLNAINIISQSQPKQTKVYLGH